MEAWLPATRGLYGALFTLDVNKGWDEARTSAFCLITSHEFALALQAWVAGGHPPVRGRADKLLAMVDGKVGCLLISRHLMDQCFRCGKPNHKAKDCTQECA